MRLRLREGVVVRRMPVSGAFVVDRSRLAAVEITEALAAELTGSAARPVADGQAAQWPAGLAEEIRRGVADGWLIAGDAR